MAQAKESAANHCLEHNDESPMFKKYCRLDFGSEDFVEYSSIEYCDMFMYKYVYCLIQAHVLQHFGPAFLSILQTSPIFVKFIESGYMRYVDSFFFASFRRKALFFSGDEKKSIGLFVKGYFLRDIREKFERDLFSCLTESITQDVPKIFGNRLKSRLKNFRLPPPKSALFNPARFEETLPAGTKNRPSECGMADFSFYCLPSSCVTAKSDFLEVFFRETACLEAVVYRSPETRHTALPLTPLTIDCDTSPDNLFAENKSSTLLLSENYFGALGPAEYFFPLTDYLVPADSSGTLSTPASQKRLHRDCDTAGLFNTFVEAQSLYDNEDYSMEAYDHDDAVVGSSFTFPMDQPLGCILRGAEHNFVKYLKNNKPAIRNEGFYVLSRSEHKTGI